MLGVSMVVSIVWMDEVRRKGWRTTWGTPRGWSGESHLLHRSNQAVHLSGRLGGVRLEAMRITRRDLLAMGALTAVGTVTRPHALRAQPRPPFRALPAALAALEKANPGRLGVAVFDTGSGERSGYRAQERFAMCSTFKMLLAAAVLERADAGREHLGRTIAVPAKPLIGNSPLTEEHAGGEMTVSALCHAILTRSDNTAANPLL